MSFILNPYRYAAPSSILTNLVSYWQLEEASGTRFDYHGTNDLTDNNTVTQATGKLGNAAQFTAANSESLTRADNASLSTGDIDFCFWAWVYLDTKTGVMIVLTKNNSATVREFLLRYNNGPDRFEFLIYDSGGNIVGTATANTFGSPSTATWYFLYAYHDSVNNLVGISVNNGTVDTGATTGAPADTAAAFRIGSTATASFWNGRIDSVGFKKAPLLTSGELATLFNSGSASEYPWS